MARYRKIDPRIWNDAKFRGLSDQAKLIFLFLLTHPNLTVLGAMRATIPGLAAELGWEVKGFAKGFAEPFAKGMVKADESAAFIWLPHFLRYNAPDNPNVVKSWQSALDLLPECPLYYEMIQEVKGFLKGLPIPFQDAMPNSLRNSMPNQKQEQEQEQEQEEEEKRKSTRASTLPKKRTTQMAEYTPGFLAWWELYPVDRRHKQPDCFRVWHDQALELRTDELIEKLHHLLLTTWKVAGPERRYIKTALPYLNDARYNDPLIPLEVVQPTHSRLSVYEERDGVMLKTLSMEYKRMHPDQSPDFFLALEPLAVAFKTELTEARLQAYWLALHHVPLEAMQFACVEALKAQAFFPVPSVLLSYVADWHREQQQERAQKALPSAEQEERQRLIDRAAALRQIEADEAILWGGKVLPAVLPEFTTPLARSARARRALLQQQIAFLRAHEGEGDADVY